VNRIVEPELLDHLPASDPSAIRSREELLLINHLMGNQRWLVSQIRRFLKPGERLLELGAGDGSLAKGLITAGVCEAHQIVALDLAPEPPGWPMEAIWLQRSVLDDEPWPEAVVIVANLFLHHFEANALRCIGSKVAGARHFIASEPARRSLHLWQGRLLSYLADLSPVTRHDMLVSIRAGFLGDELPATLGLDDFHCTTSCTFLGAYRLTATSCAKSS